MPKSVGIDLGTTFSAVAIVDESNGSPKIIPNYEGGKITPSVIQFIDGSPIFGTEAESAFNAGEPDCVTTFKRYMGKSEPYCYIDDEEYTAEQLSTLLLRHLKEQAEQVMGDSIKDVVITVPAYFYSPEREATLNAAKAAGLTVKKIIDEPNAAVMAYGLTNWRENATILVYDLGGGTFDVTLTRMVQNGDLQTITTQGDHQLGGRDWDNRILTLLLDKFSDEAGDDFQDDFVVKSILRGLSEEVKKNLSQLDHYKLTAKLPDYGKLTVTITRDEFESATLDLLNRTGSLCQIILNDAGMVTSDITDVLLVGGSTRMPQVTTFLTQMFGKKPITHVNPDEAVALGAAIQATKENLPFTGLALITEGNKKVVDRSWLTEQKNEPVKPLKRLTDIGQLTLRETTAHAMGIIAVNPDGTRYINDIIIPANHVRPVKLAKAFGFRTSSKEVAEMEIFVLQGEKDNPIECIIPYRYVVTGIKHLTETRGKTTIKVQYSYDNNGIINVEARQENDKTNLSIRREPVPVDMGKYGLPIDPSDLMIQEPLSVVLAVDVSGSMSGTPISDAKIAMIDFVRQMDFSYTCVGVIAVSDRAEVVLDLSGDETECIRAINSIQVGQTGYGNESDPFDAITNMLRHEEGKKNAIVLADGVWYNQPTAVIASKRCHLEDIETAAIGFGDADRNFLRDISSNDANALLVSQAELTQAFGNIAQSLGGGSSVGTDTTSEDIETW